MAGWTLPAVPELAAGLRPGMVLIYVSDGREQPPWSVDLVEAGAALKTGADCARLRIRRQPAEAQGDETRLCVENQMLHAWNAASSAWQPQRPVGPGMELTLPRPNGDVVRYVTGTTSEETIGPFRIRVIDTTVTTSNAAGQPVRRLRERYAPSLTTATGGRFEVPDPNDPTGWRTQQAFELREIRPPSGETGVRNERTFYYAVAGASARELRGAMNHARPAGPDGGPHDATTKWDVRWRFRTARLMARVSWHRSTCRSTALQQQWNTYVAALTEHGRTQGARFP